MVALTSMKTIEPVGSSTSRTVLNATRVEELTQEKKKMAIWVACRKGLFSVVSEKKNKIYTEKEYFKVLRDGTNALVCSGIVLKNIEILV